MKYALFKFVRTKSKRPRPPGFRFLLSNMPKSMREDFEARIDQEISSIPRDTASGDAAPAPERLKFIAMVDTPEEVAAIVRRKPLKKYLLLSGELSPLQIAVPVFLDGKSLDSLNAEWAPVE